MSIEKDLFLVDIGPDVIDLGSMTSDEWLQVKCLAKDLIRTKTVTEVSKAYIAAFLQWLDIQKELRRRFDQNYDVLN